MTKLGHLFLSVLALGAIFGAGISLLGCGDTKKYYISETAPVSTVTIVFLDPFEGSDREEITQVVNNIYYNIVNDYSVVNNVTVSVVIDINGGIKVNGNKFLCEPGDENECPGLYEAICEGLLGDNHPDKPKWKNKGKQLEDDHKRKNR
jgi:hypothetical protein